MDQKILDFVYSKYRTDFFYRFGSTKSRDNFFKREKSRITKTLKLLPTSADSVLDAGVGAGVIFNYLTISQNYKNVQGIDLSVNDRFIELSPYQNFKLMSVCDLEFESGSFEMVVCTQVLEHLPTVDEFVQALSELRRVCRKTLFVSLPFEESLPLQSDHHHRFDIESIKTFFPLGKYEILQNHPYRNNIIVVEHFS